MQRWFYLQWDETMWKWKLDLDQKMPKSTMVETLLKYLSVWMYLGRLHIIWNRKLIVRYTYNTTLLLDPSWRPLSWFSLVEVDSLRNPDVLLQQRVASNLLGKTFVLFSIYIRLVYHMDLDPFLLLPQSRYIWRNHLLVWTYSKDRDHFQWWLPAIDRRKDDCNWLSRLMIAYLSET